MGEAIDSNALPTPRKELATPQQYFSVAAASVTIHNRYMRYALSLDHNE